MAVHKLICVQIVIIEEDANLSKPLISPPNPTKNLPEPKKQDCQEQNQTEEKIKASDGPKPSIDPYPGSVTGKSKCRNYSEN